MKPNKLIVAFESELVPGIPMPEFTAPSSYKDPVKIEAHIAKQRDGYADKARHQPYTGTFKRLMIADPSNERVGNWTGKKGPICLAARNWLLSAYPDAWEHSTHPSFNPPEVVFVGFRTRLFIKMLGIECSLPANQPQKDGVPDPTKLNVLPLSMWYGNNDHRDLENAAMHSDYSMDWNQMLSIRGIDPKGWTGPGSDAEAELAVATELAAQLGMLAETIED